MELSFAEESWAVNNRYLIAPGIPKLQMYALHEVGYFVSLHELGDAFNLGWKQEAMWIEAEQGRIFNNVFNKDRNQSRYLKHSGYSVRAEPMEKSDKNPLGWFPLYELIRRNWFYKEVPETHKDKLIAFRDFLAKERDVWVMETIEANKYATQKPQCFLTKC